MNVTCPNCATTYRVDPAKVPETGVRARCAICAAVFPVRREGASTPKHESPAPAAAAAGGRGAAAATAPVRAEPPRPVESSAPRPAPAPPAVSGTGDRRQADRRQESGAAQARPAAGPALAPPAFRRSSGPAEQPPAGLAPAVAPPASAPRAAPPAAGVPTAAAASTAEPAPVSRPVNPFLSQDPSLKARRLARALISDMVVYHPAKRKDGLRDGNLKELFEDEIKKSWEEYTEQVGRELAESTPYFREALNDILAEGHQIF